MAGLSPTTERLIDAAAQIMGEPDPSELAFLHAIMAQCSLPYRDPGSRDYIRENGRASLILSAGHLIDPKTRKPRLMGLPYGAKPRLLMIYVCSEAVRTQSPKIDVGDSMSAFMRQLGLAVTGGSTGTIGRFKEQLNRLTAARMQLLLSTDEGASLVNPAPFFKRLDVWFPLDHRQKQLWASEVTLSDEFFESLRHHALPLDPRGIQALQNNARGLDCYTWLAHRLPRVRKKAGERVSWQALQKQFGPDISSMKNFKRHMIHTLKKAQAVYPRARIEQVEGGLLLRRSPPPIQRRLAA